ncbi:MAG: oligosaccharide flippase family protein, partial [Verrucomicrobiota bacterium]
MSADVSPSDSAHRDRSIRLAVITSLISKLGTIALRLVSIPIAIRLLGIDQFGVYAAITMAVGVIDMLHIGIGPALTRELSQALAKGDRERERTIFATSILLSTGLTLLAAFFAASVLYHVPIPQLFGEKFESMSEVMYRAAWLGLLILLIEMICITFEMGRDGYMETRYTNAWGAAGNVVGAIALIVGVRYFPTIEFLLIAVNGSIALSKLGNTIHLLCQRPYLFPRFSLFRRKLVPSLAKDSVRFSITYIFAAAMEYNLLIFLIGRAVGPEAVGVYQVMITVHFSLAGILGMVTKPYWPALMDAFERKDASWIRTSSNRLRLFGVGFAIFTGVGMVALGPIVLPLWAGEELAKEVPSGFFLDRIALLGFSLYFALHLWRHTHQTLA